MSEEKTSSSNFIKAIINEDLKTNKKDQGALIEVLNSLMNLSLILISCDESWEIKLIGVQLLINTITVSLVLLIYCY